jgi:hypothetical protein
LVPSDHSQGKSGYHAQEDRVGTKNTKADHGTQSHGADRRTLEGLLVGIFHHDFLFLFFLLDLFLGVKLGKRLGIRPHFGLFMGDDGTTNHIVFEVIMQLGFFIHHGGKELTDVVGIKG